MTRLSAGLRNLIPMLLVLCVVAVSTGCAHKAEIAQKYHCPMHPTYVTDRPGDCPICGMKVVPIPPAGPGGTGSGATPTPPAETSATTTTGTGERRLLYYRNPMDPTVTSPVPMKDAMGMDYVPVYSGDVSKDGASLPGYATVTGDAATFERAGVRVAVAEVGRLGHAARAVGEVKADETRLRQISLKNGGWVEKLFVNSTGQAVQKGMPLLSLYSPELLATEGEFLQALDAASGFAASDLPEVRKGGEDLLNAARRRLELFDVPAGFITELERTHRTSRTLTLNAPYSGFVTVKEVFEGSRIEPGTPLFSIVDLSHVWVEADLYEYEARTVQLNQSATLSLAYDAGTSFPARVSYIYPYLNSDTRTLRVRFEVDNPGQRLKPGMFAQVVLSSDETEGVLVPDAAVMDTGTRQLVFVATAVGRFEPRAVVVGPRANGQALLLSGVQAGEKVAIAANFLLDSESKLQSALAGASLPDSTVTGSRK